MKFKEQCHMRGIPKNVVLHAIESIGEAMIADARYRYGDEYGFKSVLEVNEKKGTVFYEIHFFPYTYLFKWLVEKEKDGYLITMVGQVPNSWSNYVTHAPSKMRGLVETQWAALFNFGLGYLTANYYKKTGAKPTGKKDIAAAKKKVTKKKRHKKTKID